MLCLGESRTSSTLMGWCTSTRYQYFCIGTAVAVCAAIETENPGSRDLWLCNGIIQHMWVGVSLNPKQHGYWRYTASLVLILLFFTGSVTMCWILCCRQGKKIFFFFFCKRIWNYLKCKQIAWHFVASCRGFSHPTLKTVFFIQSISVSRCSLLICCSCGW